MRFMTKFSLNQTFTFDDPPLITDNDVVNNIRTISINQQVQKLKLSMPNHILHTWWDWLDAHGGDSDTNQITNQELAKYYQKTYLWNDSKSSAIVAKTDDDYTVIVHDNIAPSDALLTNYIMLPMGAI